MNVRFKNSAVGFFFIAWLLVSIIVFIFSNRISYIHFFVFPSWSAFLESCIHLSLFQYSFDILFSLIDVIIFSLVCVGVGLFFLERISDRPTSGIAIGVTAFIIGEILFSLLFLSVISTVGMTPNFTIITLLIGLTTGVAPLKRYLQTFNLGKRTEKELNNWEKTFLVLTTGIIFLSLLLSSSRLGYDAVSDYFSQAKIMAISQVATSFFPNNNMIVSSLHPDILFTAIIQLFGDQPARMFSWVNGVAILLIGHAIAEESGYSLKARIYFTMLLITSTAFTDLLGEGKVELICTAPIITALYWMMYSLKRPTMAVFLIIGLLSGFAIISRLYNIFLVPTFITIFYVIHFTKIFETRRDSSILFAFKETGKWILPILWMLLPLLLIGLFHLWLNWLWLGSPLAPLKFRQNLAASNWEWQFNPANLNVLRLLYPFTVSFFNTPQSLGNISPLFVGFLPFLFTKAIRTRILIPSNFSPVFIAAILTLTAWITLFYTVVEVRYVFFLWLILFLPAGTLIGFSLESMPTPIKNSTWVFITILLLFISLRTIAISISTYSVAKKNGAFDCKNLVFCTFFEAVNQTAKPGDRVLALNAYRYYFRPDLFACSSQANEYTILRELAKRNSPDFWVEVYRQGYHFVVYEKNFSAFHSGFGVIPSAELAPQWLTVKAISSSNNLSNVSYLIEAHNPPFMPKVKCLQKDSQSPWRLIQLP